MSAVAVEPVVITEPGLYQLDAEAYHADPVPGRSLSSTGARKLIKTCPAIFREQQLNGQAPKAAFDLGKAAHRLVLGDGPEIVEVKADDWRTKLAQQQRDEARGRGAVPLLTRDVEIVRAMAVALAGHPIAGRMFDDAKGRPEQAAFWQDTESGVWCRALFDWLPSPTNGRLILSDYKTAVSADPVVWAKAAADYGYHQQAQWYLTAAQALGLADDDAEFVFVVQEKTAPYPVTVVQLDSAAMKLATRLNRWAIDLYAECVKKDRWPGYSDDDVVLAPLPEWYMIQNGGQ